MTTPHKGFPTEEDLQRIAERRERVVTLTHQGHSAAQIAVILRVTERTVQRDRAAAGCAQPPAPPLTVEERRLAEQLLNDGCSAKETARTIGRSIDAILSNYPGRGWTPQQRNEYNSALMRWRRRAPRLGVSA